MISTQLAGGQDSGNKRMNYFLLKAGVISTPYDHEARAKPTTPPSSHDDDYDEDTDCYIQVYK